MIFLYLIIFFLFGVFIGFFLTILGLKLPVHGKLLTKFSCDKCHFSFSFLDTLKFLFFPFYYKSCPNCHKKMNPLFSSMEFFTGILFALAYYVFGFSYELLVALGIVCMLNIISVSDIAYYIIPDEVLIFFSGYFIIIKTFQFGVIQACLSVLSGLILFAIMYGIMIIGNFVLKKESLGGGDIKMMFVFGLVFHPLIGLLIIFLGSLLALPVSLIILLHKKQNLVPFGPFLLISFLFLYFIRIELDTILNFIRLL